MSLLSHCISLHCFTSAVAFFKASVTTQRRSTIDPAVVLKSSFSLRQIILWPEDSDNTFKGWGTRGNRRQVGVTGVRGIRILRYSSCSVSQNAPLYLSHHHPPSLTVSCPSTSCRFPIKENISLMPSSTPPFSLPFSLYLLLSSLSHLLTSV